MKTGTVLITITPPPSTSACPTLPRVGGAFRFLDLIPLGFEMDAEHIWSGPWPCVWPAGPQRELAPLSGRPAESLRARSGCSQIICQEISLILISSVTKVDQAVLSKTGMMAEMQMLIREMRTVSS